MTLGIAAVVALTSIAWGFEASWQKANDARGTDLIVTRSASENAMPSPFVAAGLQQRLRSFPHVEAVDGLLSEVLTVDDRSPPVFVFGWAYGGYLWKHLRLVQGQWPANDADASVMLGRLAVEVLHKKTGDTLEIEGHPYRVVGIFESSAVVENGALLMTLSQAQEMTDKPGKVNILNIKMDSSASEADLANFKSLVSASLPGYVAITSGELVRSNAAVRVSKAMSSATVLIASLVGALMVFNTMLMSVSERTREIGILLALGWRRRTIMELIVSESVMLSLLGGVFGVFAGVAMAWVLSQLELMRGKIDPIFPGSFLLEVLALSVFLGIAGGAYPAYKAARELPANALRHE
jgi:putative ABC transport system permease protein